MKRRSSKRRQLSLQPLEPRQVLAASLGWDGPGLGSADLTYTISGSPNGLSQAETNAAIASAFAAWGSAADITFTPATQTGLQDSIDISFVNIDGTGGALAQAYFPDDVNQARIAGDIQFDISESWEVGNSLGNRAFDLVWVAVHEIGHSLGLDHHEEIDSVLAPFVSPSQTFTSLHSTDVAEIQELYSANERVETTANDANPVSSENPIDEAFTNSANDDDNGDTDDNPFAKDRWRRGGHWQRWGGRLDAELVNYNYVTPTDVNGDNNTSALDALMVINRLKRSSSSEPSNVSETEDTGLCDVNGDGAVTAVDALTVINALDSNSQTTVASATIVDVPESTQGTEGISDADESLEVLDDTIAPVNEVEDTDTTNNEHDRRRHPSGIFHVGLFGKDAGTLITRFDTDDDAALSEGEVSERLWTKFAALDVDADADGLVTLSELEAAITAARQEVFNEKDTDGNGSIVETEVSERFWKKIAAADNDADGGVSLVELETFIAAKQADANETGTPARSHNHSRDAVFASIGRVRRR